MITVGLADPVGWLNIQACGENFNVVIFSDPINVIQVRHSVMVRLLVELYSLNHTTLSDLDKFQGHNRVGFNLKFYVLVQ